MITFSITKENAKVLDSFVKKSKDICTNSKYILTITENKLFVAFESSFFAAKYYVDVSNITTDPSLTYFSCDLIQLSQTIQKLIKGSDYIVINIEDKEVATETTVTNPTTGTVISFTEHEKKSDKEIQNIIGAYDLAKDNQFTEEVYEIKPDNEFINLMKVICKSMAISTNEVNAAVIHKNIIRYCDPQGIIEYILSKELSPYDKDIYIQNLLIDYIKPYFGFDMSLIFDSTNQFVNILVKDFDFSMILALNQNMFQYPTEEELAWVDPIATNQIKISVKKDDLLDAIRYFDNVFTADWKWANIELDSSKELLDSSKIKFSHGDYNAHVETTVDVEVIENTTSSETCNFLIGSAYLRDILELMSEATDVNLYYSPIEIGEANGTGFIVEADKVLVTCIKIIKSDA